MSDPEIVDFVDHPCGGEQCMCWNVPEGYKVVARTDQVFDCYDDEMFIGDDGYSNNAFTMNTSWSGHGCPAAACLCKARPFSDVASIFTSDHKLLASLPTTKISCVGSLYTFDTLSGVLIQTDASIVDEDCGHSKCYCKQSDNPPNGATATVIKLDLRHDDRSIQSIGPFDFNACQASGFQPVANKYYYLRAKGVNKWPLVVGSVARPDSTRAKDLNEGTQVRLEDYTAYRAKAQAQWRFEVDDSGRWSIINRYSGQKLARTTDGDRSYEPVDMSFSHQKVDPSSRPNTVASTTLSGSTWYASCVVGSGVSFSGSGLRTSDFLRLNEDGTGLGTTANSYKIYATEHGTFSCPDCPSGWSKKGSCSKKGSGGTLSPSQKCGLSMGALLLHMKEEQFFAVEEITHYLAPDLFADSKAVARGMGDNQDERSKFRDVYKGGLVHAIGITSQIATGVKDASDAVDAAAAAGKLAVKVTADVTKNLKTAGSTISEASNALQQVQKVGTTVKLAKAIVKWLPVMTLGLELLDLSLGLAFPQPTVDEKLEKLEKLLQKEIRETATALAGDLVVEDLDTALFTCMSTLENEYKRSRQSVVAIAAEAFQAQVPGAQLLEMGISQMNTLLMNCITGITDIEKFNPYSPTLPFERKVKYAQYGFKSLEDYALQTMVAVQEFVVLKAFHSMYYDTKNYKAGDTSSFKTKCDNYISETGFFSQKGGSVIEVWAWMEEYQNLLIEERSKQLKVSLVDNRWDYYTIKDDGKEIYKFYKDGGRSNADKVLTRMKEEIKWDMEHVAYSLHAIKELFADDNQDRPMEKYTREMCVQMFTEGPSGALINTWMAKSQAIMPANYPNNGGEILYSYLPDGRQCLGHESNDPDHTYTTKEIQDIRYWAATSIDEPAACSPNKNDINGGVLTVVDCGQFKYGKECQVIDEASAAHYVEHPELVCPPEYPFLAYKSRYCA